MRQDVYIDNDSGAWSVLSSSVVDRVIEDARGDDGQFVRARQAILGLLVGDDSFIARVVQGESLTQDEQDQWIAHYRSVLHVPCGRLLVAGGFDPDVFQWWRDKEPHARGVQEVAVPPGKYLVDVYTYLHSMNGRMILDDVMNVKLGTWFRQDHPERVFPAWVAAEIANIHDFDPGHEKEWKDLKASVDSGALKVEISPLDWVGFVIHLQSFDDQAKLTEPDEGDWFGAGQGMRKPATFPLGVAAVGAEDPEYRYFLEALLPQKPREPEPLVPAEVWSNVSLLKLTPLGGGTVDLRAEFVGRAYRLAWNSTGMASPELRLEGPGVTELGGYFGGQLLPEVVDGALHVRFPEDGTRFGTLRRAYEMRAEPWTHVPPGTTLDLVTAPLEPLDDGPMIGVHRYRGTIEMQGKDKVVWVIRETFPKMAAETLRRALAVAAASEGEAKLVLANEDDATRAYAFFMKNFDFLLAPDNGLTREGATLKLAKPDHWTLSFVGLGAFRALFGDTWACEREDEDEGDEG